jgi:signal transduction histidine kinase/DNA-binding response OmpR family regulator
MCTICHKIRFSLTILVIGISSINYAQNPQSRPIIPEAKISYSSNFQNYPSFPNTCLDDVYIDSNHMFWFGDCSTSNANTSGLYFFDGYKFKFEEFSNPFNKSEYNEFTGIIDDKVFGFTYSLKGNVLFYYDLKEKRVITYDTLNKRKGMPRFGRKGSQLIASGIINDTIYNYKIIKDSIIKINTYTKKAKLIFHGSIKISNQFEHKNTLSHYLFFYKNWVIEHQPATKVLLLVNLKTGKEKRIELSDYIDTSRKYRVFANEFGYNANNAFRDVLIIQTPDTSHYFDFIEHRSELFLKPISQRQIGYEYSTRIFRDSKGNTIYLDLNQDENFVYIELKNGNVFEISSILNGANTSNSLRLAITGNNFLESIFVLNNRMFSNFKINVNSLIQSIKISGEIRNIVSVTGNKLIYVYKYDIWGSFKPVVQNLENNKEITLEGLCDFNRMDLVKNNSNIWGLTYEKLSRYNINSDSCKTFDLPFDVNSFFVLNEIELILKDNLNQFWLFNTKTEELEKMLVSGKQLRLESEFFYIQKDSDESLWIASSSGLHRYNFKTKSIVDINDKIDDFDFSLNAIQKVDENQLLLGTVHNGLILLNTSENSFTKITTSQGLPNNTIASITKDNDDYYWIGTYDGVAVLDPDFKLIGNLFEEDGLVHNESNRKSATLLEDGRVAIGSIKGVSIIDTKEAIDKFKEDKNLNIYFTSVEQYDFDSKKSIALDLSHNQDIVLEPSNNKLDINFSTSNFIKPLETTYYYKVEGLQNEWLELGTTPKLSLFGLASGDYRVYIKAIDYKGNPSQNVLELGILVEDFFYNKLWFYLLIILIIGFVSYTWIKSLNIRVKNATQKINEDKLTIEKQAKNLKALDEAKTNFFTNITHEFRTPLTIINSITGIIKDKDNRASDSELNEIEHSSNQLLGMINQILDLRKLESSKMKLDFIQSDILTYIKFIVDSHQYFAQQKGISLQYSSPKSEIIMKFDAEKLKTILTNVLSNAIKYTQDSGKIEVEVNTIKDSTLYISIQDTGLGISDADIQHVFDYFNKSDSVFQSKNSSGIGLNLTKKLVELCGGEISLNSQIEKGTTVEIKLPINRNDDAETVYPEIKTSDKAGQEGLIIIEETTTKKHKNTVLIIEDNEALRQILALQLQQYTVYDAKGGEEGIEKAIEIIPDIIISDVMMPKKSGYEVLETLKLDRRTSHIPIILLTAKADQESKLVGLRAKADAYLYKPYDVEELKLVVKNFIESRAQMQELYKKFNKTSPSTDRPQEDQFILELRDLLIGNIKEDFGIHDLCEHLKISRAQLHNKLKALTGLSTSNYILLIRLQKAKELLESTLLNMSEIAYEVGLKDPNYFSRKFKEEYGVSPSQWKKEAQQSTNV